MEETRTADASEQAFVETAVGDSDSMPRVSTRDLPVAGDAIGRYVVLDILGRGGMGVVLAAFDPELDRKVALKLLRGGQGAGSTIGRQRLVREAQAMAKLSHPNIISVHDVGEWRGQVFVAMEFVDGQTLKNWVKAEDRGWSAIVAMYAQAAAGLEAAHRAGIVHRDFKPDNCMVDGAGRLRVLDFGLASDGASRGEPRREPRQPAVSETTASEASLTQTGAVMGTPAYMAPEQHLGEATNAQSDQFSFCVALFEAIYGQRPFPGDSPASLMFNVLEGQVRAPENRGDAPPWLYRTLLRGLARESEQRWPSMAQLIAALERPVRTRQRLRRIGALAAVGLVVAGGFLAARSLEQRRSQAAVEERERQAEKRLEQLRPSFARMVEQGDQEQAFQTMESFAGLDDVRGTRAVSAGWLALGLALAGSGAEDLGLQSSANALASAPDHEAEQRVLLAMVEPFVEAGRWGSLQAVLARIDPNHDGESAVRRARVRSSFVHGDFPATIRHADGDPSEEVAALGGLARGLTSSYVTELGPQHPLAIARLDGEQVRVIEAKGDEVLVRDTARGLPIVRRHKLPVAAIRDVFALEGTGTVVVHSAQGSGGTRNFFAAGRDVHEAPSELGRLVAVASGDLQADGVLEHYGAVSYYERQLVSFERSGDRWQVAYPHPPTNELSSDVDGVVTGDFDGDGRLELAVGIGPWNGYTLRIFRAGDSTGSLEEVTSLEMGAVGTVLAAADRGKTRLFVRRAPSAPNTVFFSKDQPHGPYPEGLYELGFDGVSLDVIAEYPRQIRTAEVFAADLNADGREEIVIADRNKTSFFTLDGVWAETEAFVVRGVGNLDEDAADELLVRRDGELLVMGDGDGPLEPIVRPAPKRQRPPARLFAESATIREVWSRGETLIEIGLAAQAVAVFEKLAPLCAEKAMQAAAVIRAAELAEQADSPERALEVYEAALRRAYDWRIAEPAAVLAEEMHEFERALELWEGGPKSDRRAQALARLRERTAEPVDVVSRYAFLPESTRLGWPGGASFKRGVGVELLAPAGEGELLRIPLEVSDSFVSIDFEGAWTLSEWGSGVGLRLVDEQGAVLLGARATTNGGSSGISRIVRAGKGSNASWAASPNDRDHLSLRLEAVGRDRLFRMRSPQQRLARWEEERSLEPGHYDLVLTAVDSPDVDPLLMRFELESLRVRGATVRDDPADKRSQRLYRSGLGHPLQLSEDEGPAADTSMVMWTALELERQGDRRGALRQLEVLDHQQDPGPWELALRIDRGRFLPLLRASIGDDVWKLWGRTWLLVAIQHPGSADLESALSGLPADLSDVGAVHPETAALMLWWRGRSHLQNAELHWARRDLEAAVAAADRGLEAGFTNELELAHASACRLLASVERSRGAEDEARAWEARYVARSAAPELARRQLRRDRERFTAAQSNQHSSADSTPP